MSAMPVRESDGVLRLLPTIRPRLQGLVSTFAMGALTAACIYVGATKGQELLTSTDITLGEYEPFREVAVYSVWGCAALCLVVTLWSLWTVTPLAKRMTVEVGEDALVYRPYIGFRKRVPLSAIAAIEDHQPLMGSVCLRLRSESRKRLVDIPKNLYLPPDLKRLRQRIDPGHDTRAAAEAVATAAQEAAADE